MANESQCHQQRVCKDVYIYLYYFIGYHVVNALNTYEVMCMYMYVENIIANGPCFHFCTRIKICFIDLVYT